MKALVVMLALAGPAGATPGVWGIRARGAVVARLSVETDLSRHREFAPLSVAPDVGVGVAGGVALVVHSSRTAAGQLGAGSGICLTGPRETLDAATPACPQPVAGTAASVLVVLTPWLAGRAGLMARGYDPLRLALATGMHVTGRRGRWWVLAAPSLAIGVTTRAAGNLDRLQVPVYGGIELTRGEVHLRTGIDGALATFAETFAIPLGLGGSVDAGAVRFGVDATLDQAFGPLNGLAWRSASVYAEMGGS